MIKNARFIQKHCKGLYGIKKARVHSLSPLASAFDKPYLKSDFESDGNVGLFGLPELQSADGFHDLKDNVLSTAKQLVNDAVSQSPSAEVVKTFDNLSNELCKVADLAEFTRLTHPDPNYAQAAEQTSFEIGGYVEKLNTNFSLYKALDVSLRMDSGEMDPVTRKVAELLLFDFEQSGIHLDKKRKEIAVGLHEAVIILGARFTEASQAARRYPLGTWPKDLAIPYKIDGNHLLADATYCESSDERTREHCHKAYFHPCADQQFLLENLFHARYQLASLLGFESFAQRTLKGTTATSPEIVDSFLTKTLDMLTEPMSKEISLLSEYKSKHDGLGTGIKAWDLRYYTNLVTTQMYNLSSSSLREYFSVGSCMEGLNLVFSSLFGVTLKVVQAAPGEVWAPLVQKIEVHDGKEILGYLYCDFYQRPGKLAQDSHFTIRGGKELDDGTYQLPIIALNCNFPAPQGDRPALLSQGMVENLFHEMGHAMHSMLARTRYQHVTGTRCATDFAEVPSILMEYFAMDPRILPLYAKHYKTGQPLPQEIIDMISNSKKLFAAMDLHTQAFYSIVDQRFHGKYPLGKPNNEILDDLHKEYSPLSHVQGADWHLRFNHFHSYGAKYYSYVWSKAVASQIWYEFFDQDPLSFSSGSKYRYSMLQHGGGVAPQTLIEDMLGRPLTTDGLVSALKEDLKK
eukprot:TCONS_00049978-protein